MPSACRQLTHPPGKTFAASVATTPAILKAPAPLLVKQWKTQFEADKIVAPAISVFSAVIFGYISFRGTLPSLPPFRRLTTIPDNAWTKTSILYASSSALLLSLVPYTFFLGEPVNKKLEEKSRTLASLALTDDKAEVGVAKEESVHSLVDKWATINFGRFAIATVAALASTWAAIDRAEVVPAAISFASGADRVR